MCVYIYIFIYTHICVCVSVEVQPSFTQYCVNILQYIAILHNISRYIVILREFRNMSRYADTYVIEIYIHWSEKFKMH